jgi:hypothetical protein
VQISLLFQEPFLCTNGCELVRKKAEMNPLIWRMVASCRKSSPALD